MNIIISETKELLLPILPFINLDKFIVVSSQINAKILAQNNAVNYLLYDKSLNIDIQYFMKYIKHIFSFNEFISIISNKKKEVIPIKTNGSSFADRRSDINDTDNVVETPRNRKLNRPVRDVNVDKINYENVDTSIPFSPTEPSMEMPSEVNSDQVMNSNTIDETSSSILFEKDINNTESDRKNEVTTEKKNYNPFSTRRIKQDFDKTQTVPIIPIMDVPEENEDLEESESLITNSAINVSQNKIYSIYNSEKQEEPINENDMDIEIEKINKNDMKKVNIQATNNKIYVFTSVKGGVGVSTLITKLAKMPQKKLIIDLGFTPGGSDISYYLDLPQVPHIGTYIDDAPNNLDENTINVSVNTKVIQAPAVKNIYDKITKKDILNIIQYTNENVILIDMPMDSKFSEFICSLSTKIFIVTSSTPMEINRINSDFSDYKDKIECLVINPKKKDYKRYFDEYKLPYLTVNAPLKQMKKHFE